MTNHWVDIENSDRILVIGANPTENHPASFGHVTAAMDKGAKLIVVDPRFTRSASLAHIYAPMRSGTDVAFIGGIIKYVLDDIEQNPDNYNMDYIKYYTNAALLINEDYQGPDELDGLFKGWNDDTKSYDKSTWQYQMRTFGGNQVPDRDDTLTDPNCVFQILKRHFDRYDPDTVNAITGTPKDTYLEVAKTFAECGAVGKSGCIMYAMGTTQHTNGTQMIRSYAILQLLLGNIGLSGGGINALRGESNVQGSTDHCLLAHILPGYLAQPQKEDVDVATYSTRHRPKVAPGQPNEDPMSLDWWKNYEKYIVSLVAAWYGTKVKGDRDKYYNYLPKTSLGYLNYSHISLFEAMKDGDVKGLMCWGQNPAVGGPNSNLERTALHNLEWLVAVDLWETETAAFWNRPGVDPATIDTEVFLLPAAASYEKEGSVTNSGRWCQWRYKCVNPPGEARADLDILNDLMLEVKQVYTDDPGDKNPGAITELWWEYGPAGGHVDPSVVAREINGFALEPITVGTRAYAEMELLDTFGHLQTDGSTSSANWLYCNMYTVAKESDIEKYSGIIEEVDGKSVINKARKRDTFTGPLPGTRLYPDWAWCWPVNRRIIYNRASVDLNGVPWDEGNPVIWWQYEGAAKWVGDVPDGGAAPMGEDASGGKPFIMKPEGLANIFGRGRADGPLPEHYEPWESPVANKMSGTQNDPAAWYKEELRSTPEEGYDVVATTYRLTEHWQAGQMTRNLPWLVELQPEMFVEMSVELADKIGVANGDKVKVSNKRGEVMAIAAVTKRFKPFQLNGDTVHQVGLPWHWGYTRLSTGDSANLLTPHVGDANTAIPEFKAFLCKVEKA
jgi:formate dehydrogenase major subunit